jgi:hypothetical protein
MNFFRRYAGLAVLLAGCVALSRAGNDGLTDTAGGWASNSTFRTALAVGQASPVGTTTGTLNINSSGFLYTLNAFSASDLDHDGVTDENDPDDDGDGIADSVELSELGTNPQDSESALRILEVKYAPTGRVDVAWEGTEGHRYELLRSGNVSDFSTNVFSVGTVVATGGTGLWRQTTSILPDQPGTNRAFYRVRLADP